MRAYEPYPEGADYQEIRSRMIENMVFFLDANLPQIVTEIEGPEGKRCLQMEIELVVKRS